MELPEATGYVPRNSYVEANRPLEEVVSMSEMLEGKYSPEEEDQLVLLNASDVMQKYLD